MNLHPSSSRSECFATGSSSQDVRKVSNIPPDIASGHDHDHLFINVAPVSQEADFHEISQEAASAPGPSGPSYESGNRSGDRSGVPSLLRLSRAFSMPSQSQLGHWQRPSRYSANSMASATAPFPADPPVSNQHMQEVSLGLADSVQAAVQTLLQLAPPHLFDPAKEQFSACAVQIPTSSMTGLLTSMKNLNYISANLCMPSDECSVPSDGNLKHEKLNKDVFDIGEVLQSVGDSLGGIVAEAEVDLVLHHGDAIKHMGVKGDECGISYALSHIIFQVIGTTRPGDNVEVGLCINEQPVSPDVRDHPCTHSESSSNEASSFSPVQDTVVCTFKIAHRFSSPLLNELPPDRFYSETSDPDSEVRFCYTEKRPNPHFNTAIFTQLLRQINGTLQASFQDRLSPDGRQFEFAVVLERGPSLSDIHRSTPPAEDETFQLPCADVPFAREPSIDELMGFAETLRCKRVVFHASSRGSFAHHLTRYLTAWGMDISHVPTDGAEEKDPAEDTSSAQVQSGFGSLTSSPGIGMPISGNGLENVPPIVDSASDGLPELKPVPSEAGLSLVIIDDDVLVLRRQLLQHRAEIMPHLYLQSRKRPSLVAHHRPRSSPSIRNAVGGQQQQSSTSAPSLVPIVHFTSLANYKLVRDAIQALILTPTSPPIHPEVIVIPKPAGPRRILTALHTAFNKPIVDPFFLPIATSPMSPTSTVSSFMSGRKSFSGLTPPTGSRSAEPLTWATSESVTALPTAMQHPPSPLSYPEGLEYFCDGSVKQLGGNAASGLVIQSPDGRPAGIFFHPQSRTSSSKSDLVTMTTMERERVVSRPGSQRSSRRSTQMIRTDIIEATKETTARHGSPSNPWLVVPVSRPSLASTVSSPPERPRFGDQTDLLRPYKGRGRPGILSAGETDGTHTLPSAAWREATQISAKQPLAAVTSLESHQDLAASTSVSQSPKTDPTSFSPTRLIGNLGNFAQATRPPTSQVSPEPKVSGIRRATPGTKSPIGSKSVKRPKPVSSNIVPPISVLIVEDNAINQTILSTFMRRNKIKYEVAWNGREAVEKWRNGNFHLILMDIQMPVMDGIEATKEIRRLEKAENVCHFPPSPSENSRRSTDTPDSRPSSTASTPFRSQVIIVALTASSLQSDRVAALAAGCNDFLTKPVTNSWLNDKIMEWGSIKALQMWAELRPEVARNISEDQVAKAQDIAKKLHVPVGSARGSPLRGTHAPLPDDSQDTGESEEVVRPSRKAREAIGFSERGGSSLDSSPERWPMSSDDDLTQDPITEPPAVIVTPIRSTIELPELGNEPGEITGKEALYQFWKEANQESHLSQTPRPTLLGQQATRATTSSTSISSVMHDTPGT